MNMAPHAGTHAAVSTAITAATTAAAAARGSAPPSRDASAYDGPPNGDYVAYLEAIEQRQMMQLGHAQSMSETTPRGSSSRPSIPTVAKLLTAVERDAIRTRLATARSASEITSSNSAQWVMAGVGVVLVLLSMLAGGGIVSFLIGLALLWTPLSRLRRLLRNVTSLQRAQVGKLFGDPAGKA